MRKLDAVKISNLDFSYNGEEVLKNISFSIKEGDFAGIIGPNGSGKTTVIKIILGLLEPKKGSVKLFGTPIENFTNRKTIGYIPQKYSLDKNFPATVKELFSLVSKKGPSQDLLKKLGITNLLDKKFIELSGGQQQRVMTAMALVDNPRLLILDEPSVGVDIKVQKEFHELLHNLSDDEGITIILVSHDIGMISKYAKSVICINRTISCAGPVSKIPRFLKEVYGDDFRFHVHHGV